MVCCPLVGLVGRCCAVLCWGRLGTPVLCRVVLWSTRYPGVVPCCAVVRLVSCCCVVMCRTAPLVLLWCPLLVVVFALLSCVSPFSSPLLVPALPGWGVQCAATVPTPPGRGLHCAPSFLYFLGRIVWCVSTWGVWCLSFGPAPLGRVSPSLPILVGVCGVCSSSPSLVVWACSLCGVPPAVRPPCLAFLGSMVSVPL